MAKAARRRRPFARRMLPGSSSSLNPGSDRTNRIRRTIGRTSEMIVFGCRSRRPRDRESALIVSD
jgi:hypothetical protein